MPPNRNMPAISAHGKKEWRMTLKESVRALIEYLECNDAPNSGHVGEKIKKNSAAAFGAQEARRQRQRGVRFDMFLGLEKLVRQVFIDLIYETKLTEDESKQVLAITHQFFDKFELGFCSEWVRQRETILVKEKGRFQILVEKSPFGVSFIGSDGHYKYINPGLIKLFGYTLKDIPTGRDWFEKAFPDPEDRGKVIATWKDDLAHSKVGESRPRTFNVKCKSGLENQKEKSRPAPRLRQAGKIRLFRNNRGNPPKTGQAKSEIGLVPGPYSCLTVSDSGHGMNRAVRERIFDPLAVFSSQPHNFDFVITDQTMPEITGAQLARKLIKIRPDIPVILCSGNSYTESKDKAETAGIRE